MSNFNKVLVAYSAVLVENYTCPRRHTWMIFLLFILRGKYLNLLATTYNQLQAYKSQHSSNIDEA